GPPDARTTWGGTGVTFDWELVRGISDRPFFVAGGLTPDNVGEAIRIARPDGVDVSTGVESAAGIKDREKIRRFVAAAKESR
ncbi:MAG: phosphoribosylanthranilate isomerase, partial [Thermoanaerobaculia bacterium]